jgi:DNA-binding NtrC family response regulator
MNKKGPIIVIENNQGDRKLFIEVFSELNYGNQVIYFNDPDTASNYLLRHKIKPFIVFSDIVLLNVMNYKIVERNPKNDGKMFKCPYLFFTTFFEQSFVIDPYSLPTHSYFIKPYDYKKFKQIIKTIVEYWLKSKLTSQYNKRPKVGHNKEKKMP